jgi:hypothetical protein
MKRNEFLKKVAVKLIMFTENISEEEEEDVNKINKLDAMGNR